MFDHCTMVHSFDSEVETALQKVLQECEHEEAAMRMQGRLEEASFSKAKLH